MLRFYTPVFDMKRQGTSSGGYDRLVTYFGHTINPRTNALHNEYLTLIVNEPTLFLLLQRDIYLFHTPYIGVG